ncbi:four helix bundle protein [Ereboglobus sp. PH5-10]|uniref:four helix bundle protein n=1 Tax=Ereboglobus sp. PH5-10 TaxID=2940629 RepID=UPI002405F7DB|nr:four helix bundle protein [Ereboglobus sp. PH5-10]MDF9828498.1 four helix bundle protein [Ereboglobus sp. PH5-10]
MNEQELKTRTRQFALRMLKVVDALPQTNSGRIIANQLGRAGTSVGANYRAACRSRSTAEMFSKLAIVEEEADETEYWLDMAGAHEVMTVKKLAPLRKEAGELVAIMVASQKTLRRKHPQRRGSAPIQNPESKIQN